MAPSTRYTAEFKTLVDSTKTNAMLEFFKEKQSINNETKTKQSLREEWKKLSEIDKQHYKELAHLTNTRKKTSNYETCLSIAKQPMTQVITNVIKETGFNISSENLDKGEELFELWKQFKMFFKEDVRLVKMFNDKIEKACELYPEIFEKYKNVFSTKPCIQKTLFLMALIRNDLKITPSIVVMLRDNDQDQYLNLSKVIQTKVTIVKYAKYNNI